MCRDSDIFNVPDLAVPAHEFALDEEVAGADDRVSIAGDDDERVVRLGAGTVGVELGPPGGNTEVDDNGELAEDFEVPAGVVRRGEWAYL